MPEMIHARLMFPVILIILISVIGSRAADPVAVVVKIIGRVEMTNDKSPKPEPVKNGTIIFSGDKLRTSGSSLCDIKFVDDKSLLRIKENSVCTIEGDLEKDFINKNIILESGTVFASLFKQRGQFHITTPTSVASVKGTQFYVIQFADGRTMYIGIEGLVDLSNDAGRVLLRSGQTAVYSSSKELPEMRLTNKEEIPAFTEGNEGAKIIEIEFRDPAGQVKKMRIDYTEEP